jgi:hypothetical protein
MRLEVDAMGRRFDERRLCLDEAAAKSWTVMDMKSDWRVIFPN